MPKMSGLDAYLGMSAINPQLPAIFVTGYASDEPIFGRHGNKEAVVLQKPYSRELLGHRVREMLDRAAQPQTDPEVQAREVQK